MQKTALLVSAVFCMFENPVEGKIVILMGYRNGLLTIRPYAD